MPGIIQRTRKVRLYGILAREIGTEFDVAARSPGEAIRLLEANFPGKFTALLGRGAWHIVVGNTTKPGDYYDEDHVNFESSRGDIHIIPAIAGANSKGLIKAILGVTLVALAFVTGGTSLLAGAGIAGAGAGMAASTGFLGMSWGSVALFGASLAFSGISSMLTQTPKDKTGDTGNAQRDSFFFNGPINKTNEGAAVPLVYGHILAGSVVVHGSMTLEKLVPGAISAKTVSFLDA